MPCPALWQRVVVAAAAPAAAAQGHWMNLVCTRMRKIERAGLVSQVV